MQTLSFSLIPVAFAVFLSVSSALGNNGKESDFEKGDTRCTHSGSVVYHSFSKDGKYIVSSVEQGGKIYIWDAGSGRELACHEMRGYTRLAVTSSFIFSGDSKAIFWGNSDGVWCWNWQAKTKPVKIAASKEARATKITASYPLEITHVSLSPAPTKWLAYSDYAGECILLDLNAMRSKVVKPGAKSNPIPFLTDTPVFHPLVWCPSDEKLLFLDRKRKEILQYDPATEKQETFVKDVDQNLRYLQFTTDGAFLFGVADERSIFRWDTRTKEKLVLTSGHSNLGPVALSEDGKHYAVGDDENGVISVYSLNPMRPVRRFRGQESGVVCLSFSPDGGRLVSSGEEKNLRIFRTAQK